MYIILRIFLLNKSKGMFQAWWYKQATICVWGCVDDENGSTLSIENQSTPQRIYPTKKHTLIITKKNTWLTSKWKDIWPIFVGAKEKKSPDSFKVDFENQILRVSKNHLYFRVLKFLFFPSCNVIQAWFLPLEKKSFWSIFQSHNYISNFLEKSEVCYVFYCKTDQNIHKLKPKFSPFF